MLDHLPQFIISGLTSGSIYALIALGFGMVHNATGIVNFAQGDLVMLGAMTMITLTQSWQLPTVSAFMLAVLATMGVGVLLERIPLRASRSRHVLILVMITVGASFTIRGLGSIGWGKNPHTLPAFSGETPIMLGNAAVIPQTLWIIGITLTVVALLHLFFNHTLIGKGMRAVADNPKGAALIGISVNRMVMLSFMLSGALGAVAGIIVTPITTMSYGAGVMLGLKGFAAAILGGYGSMGGAVVGGLSLGLIESLGAGFISSAYKDAIAFFILLVVLFIRPAGLWGKTTVKRV